MALVSKAQFDKTFGADFLGTVPQTAGVYLYKDRDDAVLYVGKAKDLRRRLRSYRNASRKKVHRKMRTLVREAKSIEIRETATERDALLLENEIIRTERPPYNVDGAFSFLYPAVAILRNDAQTVFCFTTHPDNWAELDVRLFGCFRSRLRTKEAFDALCDLLKLLGHKEPWSKLPELPRDRGSRFVGIRRLELAVVDAVEKFLAGESRNALELLALRLLDKPTARAEAKQVGENLRTLAAFFETDAEPLYEARHRVGYGSTFVPQQDRDALFIKAKLPEE